MKIRVVTAEYDRRLDEIRAQYDRDIEAVVFKWKKAQEDLRDWFDKTYDGLKEVLDDETRSCR